MDPFLEYKQAMTRRHFFGRSASGLGVAALGSCLNPSLFANDLAAGAGGMLPAYHHAAKAKRVIWLFMADGPSQLDLWDYKPNLGEYFDKDLPESVRNGQRITTMTSGQARFPVAPSMFKFAQQANRECGSVSCCRTWRRPSTTCASSSRCIRMRSIMTRQLRSSRQGAKSQGVRRSAHGCRMGSAAQTMICQASSCSSRGWFRGGRPRLCSHACGPQVFCPRSMREFR